jgi:hypothetical protein
MQILFQSLLHVCSYWETISWIRITEEIVKVCGCTVVLKSFVSK